MLLRNCAFILFVILPFLVFAQQQPDVDFAFNIAEPEYEKGEGPVLCIDSAHNNFHTLDGGFAPFARVLQHDGYVVKDFNYPFTETDQLKTCNVFVIVNPLHESNIGNWVLPNPSAFSKEEILSLNQWVKEGGALFLIADHMPFAGAASELGLSFGFRFRNGFATLEKDQDQPDLFTLENGRLLKSPVSGNEITSVTTFTGSAFTYPEEAIPVLVFKKGDFSLEPERAWQFDESTKTVGLGNHTHGAIMEYGSGKLAVFGEAAMFTAQTIQTPQGEVFKIGLNNTQLAPQNLQFLLTLMHWLD
ncbi:MAG TPA: DUF4350 domain-containing protein [Gracilimonas sp.]|uniref:DUF4350 domain-containing protein n=1 Tax=Gracilimonas sp. TaxID=1974203 RepID=UPI002D9EF8FA|nr:DUF4350 domain-containing protein [Gracilimonas sp.]